ncbi:hypothetical protein GHT06_020128 [Daphnia sinensis]|uniref:Uncharacterized protein n=1 Tax=Daphnia sinensis TaxID=1820382 RepID=A0AAD5PP80_9CRUS|nr:hypothetical protein GHT06_020128 [Daphnia sinensis]
MDASDATCEEETRHMLSVESQHPHALSPHSYCSQSFAIIIRLFTLGPFVPQSNDAWVLAKPGLTQAVAIASFAYMCHHSTFLLYGSLKQPAEARWARLTHVSTSPKTDPFSLRPSLKSSSLCLAMPPSLDSFKANNVWTIPKTGASKTALGGSCRR